MNEEKRPYQISPSALILIIPLCVLVSFVFQSCKTISAVQSNKDYSNYQSLVTSADSATNKDFATLQKEHEDLVTDTAAIKKKNKKEDRKSARASAEFLDSQSSESDTILWSENTDNSVRESEEKKILDFFAFKKNEDTIQQISSGIRVQATDSLHEEKQTEDSFQKNKEVSPAGQEKLLENTGSNYFNATVLPVMSDQVNTAFTFRLLHDSVTVSSNKDFVYNSLTINNISSQKIEVQVVITSPPDWQAITSKIITLQLEPFANSIIPIRMSPSGNNTSEWKPARIEYRLNNTVDTRKTFFYVKVREYSGFKASLPNSFLVLTHYQKENQIPVFIKNSGNVPSDFRVEAASPLLKLNSSQKISLLPGKDTLLQLSYYLSESQYALLKKEEIRISVSNQENETLNFIQTISKVGSTLRDHESAFLEMPLQLEAGVMYQGNDVPLQYYGALYGTLDLDQYNKVALSLRTNTFSKGQTNDNSILRLDYTGKHFQASVGNIQGAGEFMVDGYGTRIGYEWKGYNKIEIYSMLKSRVGDVKAAGAAAKFFLNEKLNFSDVLSLARDEERQMSSGILSQISEYKFSKGKLSLITGIGAEKNDAPLAESTKAALFGSSLGYNFQWNTKDIAFISSALYNSNNYPGAFKGQRVQTHDLRWLFKNYFAGGFYEYNFRKQNYWMDSLLYTDVFNLRTSNYGIHGGANFKGSSVIISAGSQRQVQEGELSKETVYNYLNLNLSALILKKIYLNVNSYGGYIGTVQEKERKTFVSSVQGNFQFKTYGFSARFDNGPYYYQDYLSYLSNREKYSRIIIGPYSEFHFFKNTFNLRIQANYAKVLPSEITNTNVLANLTYNGRKYDLNFNGILPLGNSQATAPYLNVACRFRLNAPFLPVRKFYSLKLVLFKDENSNGKKDMGEAVIAGQTLSLNGNLFMSDENGEIFFKNVEKGIYKADFGYSSRLKGWMPAQDITQIFEMNGNRTFEVPYKISKVLSGILSVEKDSLSGLNFRPGNIKVTATGENGESYTTLTDENGNFYFNLPSGNYIISLSEQAFSEQFKPTEFSQTADLISNDSKILYFDIKQKRRQINIKRK